MKRFELRRGQMLLIGLAAILACTKGDAPRIDSAKRDSAGGTRRQMPGALTKALDEYTGDEFFDFVERLDYTGGHERERKCTKDPACQGTKRTKVLVDAVATQDSIAPSNAPTFGAVYVRAINKGDAEESRYGLQPGKQFEYYLIISGDSATGMRWRLEQLDTTSSARRHSQVGAGAFVSCDHAWVAGARADFKTCARAAASKDSIVHLGLMLQGGDDDPMWSSCAAGCCVADK